MQCRYCTKQATHFAAQSTDQGMTVTWIPVCDLDKVAWNSGGDWKAPVYKIGPKVPHKQTL